MEMVEKLNDWFGTEHETVHEFSQDLLKGDTSEIYANDESKLVALLMFLLELDDGF